MAVTQAVRLGFRKGIERGNRVGRNILAGNKDDAVVFDQSGYRGKTQQGVVSDLGGVEHLVSDVGSRREEKGVSIGRSTGDGLAPYDATGAGAVFDDDG